MAQFHTLPSRSSRPSPPGDSASAAGDAAGARATDGASTSSSRAPPPQPTGGIASAMSALSATDDMLAWVGVWYRGRGATCAAHAWDKCTGQHAWSHPCMDRLTCMHGPPCSRADVSPAGTE
eukprot:353783-Chlamydomonas_euryale.AAC.11